MTSDPVATVHDTYRSRYVDRAESNPELALHESGPITLVSAGGDHPVFNVGFVFEPPTSEDLGEGVRWIECRDAPFWLNVADSALPRVEDLAAEHDISKHDMVLSGMVRTSLDDLPANESDVDISEVRTSDDASAFGRVFLEVFDIDPAAMPEQSSGESTDDQSHRFLGRIDGEAVAIGGAYRVGEVANVFGMGVLEEFRGRGIGTDICSSALRRAREEGCELATLESTPMAVSVYENMGFEHVVEYQLFDVP